MSIGECQVAVGCVCWSSVRLIDHQRDKRTDDKCNFLLLTGLPVAIEKVRGELEAEALAETSGRDAEGVIALDDGHDHLLLAIPELEVAAPFE